MIYLDNSATTPVRKEVLEAMKPYYAEIFGNPDARFYDQATKAKEAIESARKQVSRLLKCEEKDVIFNSGATEGNNTVLKGIVNINDKCKIITTRIEHSSIYETCNYLNTQNIDIDYIEIKRNGEINIESLKNLINEKTKLVAISWINSEIGTIQDIKAISDICYRNNTPLLVDATQAVGKVEIDLTKYKGISFLTFSAHKIGGPKGTGVLVRRKMNGKYISITPLIHGGEQEYELRAGTPNVPGIVGCGKACEIIQKELKENIIIIKEISDYFKRVIIDKFGENIIINNDFDNVYPGIINVRFVGINNELLLHNISKLIAASTGSACSNLKPSRVLKEIGMSSKEISESIRFSLSTNLTKNQIDEIKDL